MTTTLTLQIPVAGDGTLLLEEAVGRVVDLPDSTDGGVGAGSPSPERPQAPVPGSSDALIVRLYERLHPESTTRKLLEVLPGGIAGGLTPAELGRLLAAPPLSKASVRAVIRNAKRAENGIGARVGDLVKTDFSQYEQERAGRYYVEPDQRRALDEHLGR